MRTKATLSEPAVPKNDVDPLHLDFAQDETKDTLE